MRATSSGSRPPRRNRITSTEEIGVAVVAVLSALGGALAGTHPTAWRPADLALTAAIAGLVAWAGASAPWWALAVSAAIPALTSENAVWLVASVAALVIALLIGARLTSFPIGRAISASLCIQALLRWEPDAFTGLSALVTSAVVFLIVLTGLSRRRRHLRRTLRRVLLVLGVLVGLALLGGVVTAIQATGTLRDGERTLRDAVRALQQGDIEQAREALENSQRQLADASDAMKRPWARPALAVPLLGQHVDVIADIASEGEQLAETAFTSLEQVNLDDLRLIAGVIDVNAIELLETPFADVNAALRRTANALDGARSPWLVAPLERRVAEAGEEIDALIGQTDRALAATRVAPTMLGRDGPRTYFVAFTTPAEARGLGGFMGTWGELRAERGQVDVVRTGLTRDLFAFGPVRPTLDGPADFLARYGRFGAGEKGEPTSVDFWSNITMSPDFPSVADVMGDLYPQSGGTEVDGVIALDVYGIAGFLNLTGPIGLDGPDGTITLTSENAVTFLLRDLYADVVDDTARDAVLEDLTDVLLRDVFSGDLPGPRVLADALGPAMTQGRLVAWSRHAEEEALLSKAGIAGALPAPRVDGLAVVSNNAGANKLDSYLRRSITYEAVVDDASGELRSAATIRLTNDAPADLPADVGGNPFGLPLGTNRMYLSVYSPWEFTEATVDGRATSMEREAELGWNVYSLYVDVPRGGEVAVRVAFAGTVPAEADYQLLLRSQALAFPDFVRAEVRTLGGQTWVDSAETRFGVQTLG